MMVLVLLFAATVQMKERERGRSCCIVLAYVMFI